MIGALIGLGIGLSYGLSYGWGIGLIIGLSVGLLAGLHKGGLASLRHYVLRLLLWRTGSVPGHYVPFLDYAAERILLRKVGGGYIFVHRLLLEYFASLDSTPPLDLFSPPVNTGESGGDSGSPTPSSALVASLVPQGQIEPRTGRRGLSRREVVTGLVGLGGVLVIGGVGWFLGQRRGSSNPQMPKEAHNLDFTAGTASWFLRGDTPQDYEYGIDPTLRLTGKPSAYLRARVAQPAGFGTLMQAFQGTEYRGKRLRMSGYVKAQAVENWAGLWMRVDGGQGHVLSFDNMQNRPIRGTVDWKRYEIVLDVPEESIGISFGILLAGKGQVWLSEVQLQVVGKEVPTTGG